MKGLPCGQDRIALGIVRNVSPEHPGGFWDLAALRQHAPACPWCSTFLRAMAIITGSEGGRAGRGAAKRRGDSDYYRALSARRRRQGTQPLAILE